MDIQMTAHACVRQQQRRIPPLVVEWLLDYGAVEHDGHGAQIRFFDKRSRKLLAKEVGGEVVKGVSSLLDTYIVVSSTGTLLTVGHRYKRIRSH